MRSVLLASFAVFALSTTAWAKDCMEMCSTKCNDSLTSCVNRCSKAPANGKRMSDEEQSKYGQCSQECSKSVGGCYQRCGERCK